MRVNRYVVEAAAACGVDVDAVVSALAVKATAGVRGILTPAEASPKLSLDGGHTHIRSGVVYLIPSARRCPAMDAGCRGDEPDGACYNTSGRGRMDSVRASRERKAAFADGSPRDYMLAVAVEIARLQDAAVGEGKLTAVRLNGLSDIAWERIPAGNADTIMDAFPTVQFWDYTRVPGRIKAAMPVNYDLTFSLGSDNDRIAQRALYAGLRVAFVTRTPDVPEEWHGLPVIDGNAHDFRFLEPGGVMVALKARGNARKDASGWVRDLPRDSGLDLTRVPSFGRVAQ